MRPARPPAALGLRNRVRIDREKYIVEEERITGNQILALADKTPIEWPLNQKLFGGKRERFDAEELVDLSQPGVEWFETVRRLAQRGGARTLSIAPGGC